MWSLSQAVKYDSTILIKLCYLIEKNPFIEMFNFMRILTAMSEYRIMLAVSNEILWNVGDCRMNVNMLTTFNSLFPRCSTFPFYWLA